MVRIRFSFPAPEKIFELTLGVFDGRIKTSSVPVIQPVLPKKKYLKNETRWNNLLNHQKIKTDRYNRIVTEGGRGTYWQHHASRF